MGHPRLYLLAPVKSASVERCPKWLTFLPSLCQRRRRGETFLTYRRKRSKDCHEKLWEGFLANFPTVVNIGRRSEVRLKGSEPQQDLAINWLCDSFHVAPSDKMQELPYDWVCFIYRKEDKQWKTCRVCRRREVLEEDYWESKKFCRQKWNGWTSLRCSFQF